MYHGACKVSIGNRMLNSVGHEIYTSTMTDARPWIGWIFRLEVLKIICFYVKDTLNIKSLAIFLVIVCVRFNSLYGSIIMYKVMYKVFRRNYRRIFKMKIPLPEKLFLI